MGNLNIPMAGGQKSSSGALSRMLSHSWKLCDWGPVTIAMSIASSSKDLGRCQASCRCGMEGISSDTRVARVAHCLGCLPAQKGSGMWCSDLKSLKRRAIAGVLVPGVLKAVVKVYDIIMVRF